MKAALAGTPPHDFTVPTDDVTKMAACGGGGYEYYLKGTEPDSPCGRASGPYAAARAEPYATLAPYASLPPEPTLPPSLTTAAPAAAAMPPADPSSAPLGPTATPPKRR
jgi:hypothetical protein